MGVVLALTRYPIIDKSLAWITTTFTMDWSIKAHFRFLFSVGLLMVGVQIPNFRGTIFSWISWFDFWLRKFSIIVGVATFCVHRRIASTIVRIRVRILVNVWTKYWITANSVQTLCTYFHEMSKICLPNLCKDLCPNNFLHLVLNPPTTTLKRWPNTR